MSTLPPDLHPEPKPKPPRGCFFYGCLVAIVLVLGGGIGSFFLVRYALDHLAETVERYTDTAPSPLPLSMMPEANYQALAKRVGDFRRALDDGSQTDPLVLTSDDINALIANHPDWQLLRGMVHVQLDGTEARCEVAIPLDAFVDDVPGLSRLRGRHLNGKATISIRLQNEELSVRLRSLEVKGQTLPPDELAELRSHNLVGHPETASQVDEVERRIESIRIDDGKLTIVGKANR